VRLNFGGMQNGICLSSPSKYSQILSSTTGCGSNPHLFSAHCSYLPHPHLAIYATSSLASHAVSSPSLRYMMKHGGPSTAASASRRLIQKLTMRL
jgi:hypothetical protein